MIDPIHDLWSSLMTRVLPVLHDRHASTALQDAFFQALEAFEDWGTDDDEPRIRFEEKDVPISSIFGRMRASDDLIPQKVRLALGDDLLSSDEKSDPGLTYGTVARHLREQAIARLKEAGSETGVM
jgi:hypothetical protein